MVNNFLLHGEMANGLNDTNICLIPKTTRPRWIDSGPLAYATSVIR